MKTTKVSIHARGLNWGRLLGALESAGSSMALADINYHMLSKKQQEVAIHLLGAIKELERVAWEEYEAEAKKLGRGKK